MNMLISTKEKLDELPVGSVVLVLWDEPPLHAVCQRYAHAEGGPGPWHSTLHNKMVYPLGTGEQGEEVLLLWTPESEREGDASSDAPGTGPEASWSPERAQRMARDQGLCGELLRGGNRVCILEPGHDGGHPDHLAEAQRLALRAQVAFDTSQDKLSTALLIHALLIHAVLELVDHLGAQP